MFHPPSRRRQTNPSARLQLPERLQAAAPLRPPSGIVKSKLRADPVRQRRPVGELLPPHHGVQTIQLSAQGALDLVLNYHVVKTTTGILVCPALFVGIGQG